MAAGLLAVAPTSQAQQQYNSSQTSSTQTTKYSTTEEEPHLKYFANEFTFDAFGGYDQRERKFNDAFDRSWQHGKWGGGFGVNWFILRYLGVGANTFLRDQGKAFNNVSGDLTLRLPICESGLAPYIFGTGGRRFHDPVTWYYGGGAGLEYRFTRHFGLFSDARYLWHERRFGEDRFLVRGGLRFAF